MALLLLVVGLSLARAQFNPQAVVQRNYNMARISGIWYSVSMASDNLMRIKEDGDLRIFMRNIEHLKNGSLKFDFRFMVQGQCVAVVMVCKKMARNGEYSISYQGENKVLVSETDYKLYVIFYMQNFYNGTETRVLGLYGRNYELSPIIQRRFENICKKYRVSSQNIMDLSKQDPCYAKR